MNGIGACLVTLLSLTGAILWWPGIKNWRRSTKVKWDANFPRLNWDLHSAIGFWCSLFVLVWGLSGIYFCFPVLFGPRIHLIGGSFFSPAYATASAGRFDWFHRSRLDNRRALVPGVSAVTGAFMWWNRVLRKKVSPHSYRHADAAASSDTLLTVRD